MLIIPQKHFYWVQVEIYATVAEFSSVLCGKGGMFSRMPLPTLSGGAFVIPQLTWEEDSKWFYPTEELGKGQVGHQAYQNGEEAIHYKLAPPQTLHSFCSSLPLYVVCLFED